MQALQVTANATVDSVWTQQYTFTQTPNGPPIDLTGLTFQLSIRPNVADTTAPALVSVNSTAPTAQGSVTITPTAGIVFVQLTPAATLLLGEGSHVYGLWSQPNNTTSQTAWVRGPFITTLAAQP
jgi:hypothetical protein